VRTQHRIALLVKSFFILFLTGTVLPLRHPIRAGKNIFRNPNFRTWDMSVQKDWKFKERFTAQFRAESFNVLNHPLFGQVDSGHLANNDPSSGGSPFGQANKTPDQAAGNPVLGSGSNRDIQLGLKLIF
jgi:hypothetical protein